MARDWRNLLQSQPPLEYSSFHGPGSHGSNSSPRLSVVFPFASALWMRGRPYTIIGPILVYVVESFLVLVNSFNLVMIGLNIQTEKNQIFSEYFIFFCIALGYFSSLLIIDDFDVNVVEKGIYSILHTPDLVFLERAKSAYWSPRIRRFV
ncbi:MAG: hypothetical protein CM15mP8_4120 [Methanobacteriota archaeon]|nr:MAG: hypothetical protein CM15mP8_4120 [Euryarchaeota archaeon]